ncbi:MAG: hypothetical protein ACYDDF_03160 [Thermoplasmatota archaeon]
MLYAIGTFTSYAFWPALHGEDPHSKWVNDHVKPKFPWFHPYMGRTWSVNARLIATATRAANREVVFDWVTVAEWHGHNSVERLRHDYQRAVKIAYKMHGDHWLERAFGINYQGVRKQ